MRKCYSRERRGSSESAAQSGAALLVEFIPAVAGYGDFQGAMILPEQVKAFAEIALKESRWHLRVAEFSFRPKHSGRSTIA
jgi:hypothetical protein